VKHCAEGDTPGVLLRWCKLLTICKGCNRLSNSLFANEAKEELKNAVRTVYDRFGKLTVKELRTTTLDEMVLVHIMVENASLDIIETPFVSQSIYEGRFSLCLLAS